MQQDLKGDGLALSVFFIMLKLLTDTLPPPEPVVPLPTVEGLLAPKEKDRISQAFLALKSLSVVSPSAGTAPPVTYMNESNAMTALPPRKGLWQSPCHSGWVARAHADATPLNRPRHIQPATGRTFFRARAVRAATFIGIPGRRRGRSDMTDPREDVAPEATRPVADLRRLSVVLTDGPLRPRKEGRTKGLSGRGSPSTWSWSSILGTRLGVNAYPPPPDNLKMEAADGHDRDIFFQRPGHAGSCGFTRQCDRNREVSQEKREFAADSSGGVT